MIYGPDGKPLVEPLPETEEGILYADIDLGMISIAKAAADPAGHYSRPNVTRLLFNPAPAHRVEYIHNTDGSIAIPKDIDELNAKNDLQKPDTREQTVTNNEQTVHCL
ncbi:hypothetical protein [Desulfoscipio gibsoniae]|uniref:hypothetical protein n=1 Tax=Desulfoscipio gibsoniae TaxID=102134 RepID=UPI000232C372|nr:hypothetical protein [Desulfoscipio gibsoniae]